AHPRARRPTPWTGGGPPDTFSNPLRRSTSESVPSGTAGVSVSERLRPPNAFFAPVFAVCRRSPDGRTPLLRRRWPRRTRRPGGHEAGTGRGAARKHAQRRAARHPAGGAAAVGNGLGGGQGAGLGDGVSTGRIAYRIGDREDRQ